MLNHQLQNAKGLQKHLDNITKPEKKEDKEDDDEKKLTPEEIAAQRNIAREKAFIHTIASIPSYKSAEYYQLDLLNKKTKNLNPANSGGLIHQSTLKLAKRRLGQILNRLTREIQEAKRK